MCSRNKQANWHANGKRLKVEMLFPFFSLFPLMHIYKIYLIEKMFLFPVLPPPLLFLMRENKGRYFVCICLAAFLTSSEAEGEGIINFRALPRKCVLVNETQVDAHCPLPLSIISLRHFPNFIQPLFRPRGLAK